MLADGVFLRKDERGEFQLVDYKRGYEYSINPTAGVVAQRLVDGESVGQIAHDLARKYGFDVKAIKEDILKFLSHLDARLLTKRALSEKHVLQVDWVVTERCNLSCRHCFMNARHDDPVELSAEEKVAVAKELSKSADFVFLTLTGGEPFSALGFKSLLHELASLPNFRIRILTNGTLLHRFYEPLRGLGDSLGGIIVSISGTDEEVYSRLRVGGSLKLVEKNIREAIKRGLPVLVTYDAWSHNISYLEKDLERIADWGVREVAVNYIESKGRATLSLDKSDYLYDQEKRMVSDVIGRVRERLGSVIRVSASLDPTFIPKGDAKANCSIFDPNDFTILSDGTVHVCYELALIERDKYALGHIKEVGVRELLKRKPKVANEVFNLIKPGCLKCELVSVCPGACPAEALKNNPDYYARNCSIGLYG